MAGEKQEPMYIVETTDGYADEDLQAVLNGMYGRGYFVLQIIEPLQPDASDGYKVVAYKRLSR